MLLFKIDNFMFCGEYGYMKIEIFFVNFESINLIEEKESVIF